MLARDKKLFHEKLCILKKKKRAGITKATLLRVCALIVSAQHMQCKRQNQHARKCSTRGTMMNERPLTTAWTYLPSICASLHWVDCDALLAPFDFVAADHTLTELLCPSAALWLWLVYGTVQQLKGLTRQWKMKKHNAWSKINDEPQKINKSHIIFLNTWKEEGHQQQITYFTISNILPFYNLTSTFLTLGIVWVLVRMPL